MKIWEESRYWPENTEQLRSLIMSAFIHEICWNNQNLIYLFEHGDNLILLAYPKLF